MANEVVKYDNKLNTLTFSNFTDSELKIFFAICSRLKGQGDTSVSISFEQLKELTGEKRHYTVREYAEMVQSMYSKLLQLTYKYDDGKDKAGEFHLFEGYERSLSEQTFNISIAPRFAYLFNELYKEFTRFELKEFVDLRGKYTKQLYRLLKQWRSLGHYSVLIKDLRELMDVPQEYKNKELTRRILDPAVEKLRELDSFKDLHYEYSYKGKQAIRATFDWTPEVRGMLSQAGKETEFVKIAEVEGYGEFLEEELPEFLKYASDVVIHWHEEKRSEYIKKKEEAQK